MEGITVFMAIVDFIPVVLFFMAAVQLQKDLYPYLVKGAYSLLAAGSIMVFTGGFFKALWKILYALNICDYVLLDHSFFVFQGPGYFLFWFGILGIFMQKNTKTVKLFSASPVVLTTTLPFIIMQVVGLGAAQVTLIACAVKKKNRIAPVYFVISIIFMMGMGYLGAKFDNSSSMHWIAQLTNIVSMTAFLLGTRSLHKKGFN